MLDYLKNHKLIAVVSASILLSLMLLGVILITNQSNDRLDQQGQSRDNNASQPVQHQIIPRNPLRRRPAAMAKL